MLKEVRVKYFKKLDCELDINNAAVVFVGPNNSGKTSALQSIAFWEYGLKRWVSERLEKMSKASKRPGVVINRKDLYDIPIPSLKQLWQDLSVRETRRDNGRQSTKNIIIEIFIKGRNEGKDWEINLGFDFANSEICYVKLNAEENYNEKENFELALKESIVYLPPMSGLSSEEYKLEMGAIKTFIGQGRTADVLRNLCWYVYKNQPESWNKLVNIMKKMFGILLMDPLYSESTSRIELAYQEQENELDLVNLGRGAQQVLLLLSYMYSNPSTVIMIDEPDAHLEVLRQKEIFRFLYEEALSANSQIIMATHSEAVLGEAVDRANIVAFVGTPHKIDKPAQVIKALNEYGFEHYLMAEQKKWVLYLEGSTDLSFLQAFAKILHHTSEESLEIPFAYYVFNQPSKARAHFFAIKESCPELKGIALFDHIGDERLQQHSDLMEIQWTRNEIENYLLLPDVLERYFRQTIDNLYSASLAGAIIDIVKEEIPPAAIRDRNHDFWKTTKISEWLEKLLLKFEENTGYKPFPKGSYFKLVENMKPEEVDLEVKDVLDKIQDIASIIRQPET